MSATSSSSAEVWPPAGLAPLTSRQLLTEDVYEADKASIMGNVILPASRPIDRIERVDGLPRRARPPASRERPVDVPRPLSIT